MNEWRVREGTRQGDDVTEEFRRVNVSDGGRPSMRGRAERSGGLEDRSRTVPPFTSRPREVQPHGAAHDSGALRPPALSRRAIVRSIDSTPPTFREGIVTPGCPPLSMPLLMSLTSIISYCLCRHPPSSSDRGLHHPNLALTMSTASPATLPTDLPTSCTPYLSALPSNLIPLICHYLQLRQLLLWSSTDRHFRSLVCPDVPPSPAPARIAFAADCWRFIPAVQVRWGMKLPHWRNVDNVVAFEVDGAVLSSVTADVKAQLKAPPSRPQPTIADDFAGRSLSLEQPSHYHLPSTPPLSKDSVVLYPLIPSLAAVVRSLRFVRRLEVGQSAEEMRVFLTVLTVLPSFPLLHHFTLRYEVSPYQLSKNGVAVQPTGRELEQELTHRTAVVNGVFGCLCSLPALSSLEMYGFIPTSRRHPIQGTGWSDAQFAVDALNALFGQRLTAFKSYSHLLREWENHALRCMPPPVRSRVTPHTHTGAGYLLTVGGAPGSGLSWESGPLPQFASLQWLVLEGEGPPVRRLARQFPSLVLLETDLSSSLREREDPTTRRPQREKSQDGGDGDSQDGGGDSSEPALRFLKTVAHIRDLPEIRPLATFDFLHSLYLVVSPQTTGLEPLTPLTALASLTQLRELTLQVSGGSHRHGLYQLKDEEVFDLTWLDHLTRLRYLHIKAFRHTSIATLVAIGLLPPPPPSSPSPFRSSYPPLLPDFVGRIEEFGLNLFDQKVDVSRAAELTLGGWTRLRRCAIGYLTSEMPMCSFSAERLHISPKCEAANAVLRERVGHTRWVSEQQLVNERWDSRWKRDMAAKL